MSKDCTVTSGAGYRKVGNDSNKAAVVGQVSDPRGRGRGSLEPDERYLLGHVELSKTET